MAYICGNGNSSTIAGGLETSGGMAETDGAAPVDELLGRLSTLFTALASHDSEQRCVCGLALL